LCPDIIKYKNLYWTYILRAQKELSRKTAQFFFMRKKPADEAVAADEAVTADEAVLNIER
jgi:hypothetical protein